MRRAAALRWTLVWLAQGRFPAPDSLNSQGLLLLAMSLSAFL